MLSTNIRCIDFLFSFAKNKKIYVVRLVVVSLDGDIKTLSRRKRKWMR